MSAAEVFAEWFGPPRCWRVLTEASGEQDVTEDGQTAHVVYDHGRFEVQGGSFTTVFGTPAGSVGYLIQEVDPGTGQDTGEPVAFVESVLRKAEATYGTVTGLPVLTGD